MSHVMNTYSRQPIAFERGDGVWLTDTNGKRYLDAVAGIAVCALGHSHPRLVKAICDQAGKLVHTSNLYRITVQEQLADRLAGLSGMDAVFFCNSGCEANEAAIKLARLYGHGRGVDVPTTIVMEGSFHGRTMATLSATGSRKVQAGFEPLVTGFARVPYDDVAAIEQVAVNNKSVVAILVEPIIGEGGVTVPRANYLRELRRICDQNHWLLMLDEVQSGIGRTGSWFAFQHAGIRPDVMTLAKGLGGGVPIGACLAAGAAANTFTPGKHGSTFGGNPLACAAALATLEIMESEHVMENATAVGEHLREALRSGLAGLPGVREIRGHGLFIGVELDRPCGELVDLAREAGLLINVTHDNVIRLIPPLVLGREEAGLIASILCPLIRTLLSTPAAKTVSTAA